MGVVGVGLVNRKGERQSTEKLCRMFALSLLICPASLHSQKEHESLGGMADAAN